jgi:hypothetical protein
MPVTPMDIEEESADIKMVDMESFPMNNASEEEEARQAIDKLRGEDVSARVAAANRLEAVAAALGEERTRDELLPFITDGLDDEDEVLVAIASSLGKLLDHVGGPAHAHILLPPLELLLTVGKDYGYTQVRLPVCLFYTYVSLASLSCRGKHCKRGCVGQYTGGCQCVARRSLSR